MVDCSSAAMAMLSRGPPKDRDYDGASQLSQQQRRNLGDLGAGFPELRKVRTRRISSPGIKTFHTRSYTLSPCFCAQAVDLANSDQDRIKKTQKYLKENGIQGIQNQMRIAMALKAEGVLTDRVWYTMHTLIAGNAIGKNLKDPFLPLQHPLNIESAKNKKW